MDRDTAITKIKKCLALAKSANPHEASAAMRQAQKLMEAHSVDQVDISLADVSDAKARAQSNAVPTWEAALASLIAEAFGCERYLSSGPYLGARGGRAWCHYYHFVGMNGAAEVAGYAMEVLARQCARDRADHVASQRKSIKAKTKTARGDAFALAWVLAVGKLVERFAGRERHVELLSTYMAKNHPEMGTTKPKDRTVSARVNDDSYLAGRAAGSRANLVGGLGGAEPQALLEASHV